MDRGGAAIDGALAGRAEEVRLELDRREALGPLGQKAHASVAGAGVGQRDDARRMEEAVRRHQLLPHGEAAFHPLLVHLHEFDAEQPGKEAFAASIDLVHGHGGLLYRTWQSRYGSARRTMVRGLLDWKHHAIFFHMSAIPIAGFKDVYDVPAVEKALHGLSSSASEALRALYEKMLRLGGQRFTVKPSALPEIDALLDELPNFAEVLEDTRRHLALCIGTNDAIELPPMLLLGEPGIGKTHFARKIAQ